MHLAYLAAMTIVEKHKGSPQKGHAYFITPRPLINRESDKNSTKP